MPERSFDKWFWITVLSVLLIITVPFLVVWGILYLPPVWALVATIGIIILWGVAAGYKDYVISKRRQSEEKPEGASEEEPQQA
jgi:type VI protein secretion system component VasK